MSGWDTWGLPPVIDWGQILYSAIRPEQFGADPTGQSDSTAAFVAARAAALSANAACWCDGIYTIGSKQTLQATEWIHLPRPASRIIGNFSGSQLFESAGISVPTKANDIRITGPGKIGRSSTAQTGDILHIYGDRFTVLETEVNTWGGGRAFYGGGDHHFIWKAKAQINDGQVGTGGWRFITGNYSRMVALDINSADDALQFVPSGNITDPLFNIGDITHCMYEHCVGSSSHGRFIAVLLTSGNVSTNGQLSVNILHSLVRDCHGTGANRGLYITNRDSYGMIFDLLIAGCSIDMSGATAFDADAEVNEDPTNAAFFTGHVLGPLRGVTLEDLSITNSVATTAPLRVIGATENTEIIRPYLAMPASATSALIDLQTGTTMRVRGGYLDGQSQANPIISAGGGGNTVTDLLVEGTRFVGVGSSQYCVNANAVSTYRMDNTRGEPGAGQTLTKGCRLGATTTNSRIRDNDWGALGAAPLTDASGGATTQHTGNIGNGD